VYAKTAAAVPHAYHMPSHILTRLGYWDKAATTNENAWQISNDDVKEAGESGELRDFHSLNYLSYNYLQLGRHKDSKRAVDLFAAQYAITNRKTAPNSQDLQARYVRGRTILALAAHAAGDAAGAVTEMEAAVAIEDSIDSLSQPPYPIIPAHELYGSMLMDMGKPAEARRHFEETLRRTLGRPKAIVGIAQAAEAMEDTATAGAQYTRLIEMWKSADQDRPELQAARLFLQSAGR